MKQFRRSQLTERIRQWQKVLHVCVVWSRIIRMCVFPPIYSKNVYVLPSLKYFGEEGLEIYVGLKI